MEFSPEIATLSDCCLLGLLNNLIDASPQIKVSAAQCLFRGQKFACGAAAGRRFHDLIGRAELEAIGLMAMQARRVQIVVARDLRHRLANGKPTVDLRAL